MSVNSYSYNLKRVFINPVFNQDGFRSEFRFDSVGDAVVMPTLTLINHGVVGSSATKYLSNAGMMGIVKKISLFDGNVKLDDVREFARSVAFKKANRSNESAKNVDRYTDYNAMGFDAVGKPTNKGTSADVEGGVQIVRQEQASAVNTAESTTKQGIVNLAEHLSFLRSAPSLPKKVFKNLRVVIDYESDPKEYMQANNVTGSTRVPLLAVDIVKNDKLASAMESQFKGVVWKALEHDQVEDASVSAGADRVTENKTSKTHTFHGFNNKRVGRMYIAKQPTTRSTFEDGTTIFPYGDKGSLSLFGEEVQVRVNGSNKFARNGLTSKNEMLGMLVDTYGEFVCPAGQSQSGVFNMGAEQKDANTRYNRDVYAGYDNVKGMQGYVGLDLGGDIVNELKVDLRRSGCANSTQNNQKVIVHAFAEVQKTLAMQGDRYVIAYS